MSSTNLLNEILLILNEQNDSVVRTACLHQILGLTGSKESLNLLLNHHNLINKLTSIMINQEEVSRLTCLALINLSAEETGAKKILHIDCQECTNEISGECTIVSHCIETILNKESALADSCCMLLCNISRTSLHANYVVDHINDLKGTLTKLIDAFCDLKYNSKQCNLHYLGPFFSNISQSPSGVEHLYDLAERLLPFTEFSESMIRRGGIAGMLRNFSFNTEKHKWFLSTNGLNILPSLLLPLAGPEEFPEDEMDKLPIELQYLPETKKRDPDSDIRCMLLETLLQFCSSKESREILRDQNIYLILRELHKSEKDRKVLLACENVIDILIRTEDEIGIDKLNELEVPSDLQKKFKDMDQEFIDDN